MFLFAVGTRITFHCVSAHKELALEFNPVVFGEMLYLIKYLQEVTTDTCARVIIAPIRDSRQPVSRPHLQPDESYFTKIHLTLFLDAPGSIFGSEAGCPH